MRRRTEVFTYYTWFCLNPACLSTTTRSPNLVGARRHASTRGHRVRFTAEGEVQPQ